MYQGLSIMVRDRAPVRVVFSPAGLPTCGAPRFLQDTRRGKLCAALFFSRSDENYLSCRRFLYRRLLQRTTELGIRATSSFG